MPEGRVPISALQQKMLEILLYFQSFCRENGLSFTLCGGTCLGAVRHGGFIPWDDDVDVFMLREDYMRLPALWQARADTTRYTCVRSDDRVNIHHSATEIKDNHTTFINRHSVDADIHHGVMIDVIPLDGIPRGCLRQWLQRLDGMLYCCFSFQRLPEHQSNWVRYATALALFLVPWPRVRWRIWHGAERRLSCYGTSVPQKVASFGEGLSVMSLQFPTEWFRCPAELSFEGHPMPVPTEVDAYLRQTFGDYWKLPPPEERLPRHDTVWQDLQHSYLAYKGVHYCTKQKGRKRNDPGSH